MPFVRLMLPVGAIFFGAVAVFMGAVVLLNSLRIGTISMSHATTDARVIVTKGRAG